MNTDKIVLSFHDCILRQSDVEILKHPRWLNDTLISFYFEYLETVKFQKNNSILFVSPEVTQCIKVVTAPEISVFLDPLKATKKDFIFFALNDNERADCSGGSHWSLLVYSRPDRGLYHCDSHQGFNCTQARDLGCKLLRYFDSPNTWNIVEADTLQQSNSFDCGDHVLCNAEHIAHHVIQHHKIEGVGLLDKVKVINKRQELLTLICSLKKQL